MNRRQAVQRISELVGAQTGMKSALVTNIDGLSVICSHETTQIEAVLYNPVVCLIIQGAKDLWFGDDHLRIGKGEALVVSHHLPVVSKITEASNVLPYCALILRLDLALMRGLQGELDKTKFAERFAQNSEECASVGIGAADEALTNAMIKLLALADEPLEALIMEPLLRREIHFRILLSSQGATIRHLLSPDSASSRISKVISNIRQNYKAQLSVPDLAKIAGMSASSLHEHFKAVTATSPLQYQKGLRLMEARRLLLEEALPVTSVAHAVGYESPNQFSREYARQFGKSPRSDAAL